MNGSVRKAVDEALERFKAETQSRYDYTAVDMWDGDNVARGPVFAGTRLQAEEVATAINTALWDLGQLLIYELCDHEWVDAHNERVASGNYCQKCRMFRKT